MSDSSKRKRKKSYYVKAAKKQRYGGKLDVDMRGFLITCNQREKQAVCEAYNILNEYADLLYGPEKTGQGASDSEGSGSDCDDPEAAIKKEVAAMNSSKGAARRFKQVNSGATNCIFIKTTLDDPTGISKAIFNDAVTSGKSKSRHILRFVPIVCTCKAYEDAIKKTCEKILASTFSTEEGIKYSVMFKSRNSNIIKRDDLIQIVRGVVRELGDCHKFDWDNPDVIIYCDVIRAVCCLSVLSDFKKFRKYNLQEAALSSQTKPSESEATGEVNPNEPKETGASDTKDNEQVINADIEVLDEEKEDSKTTEASQTEKVTKEAEKVDSVTGEVNLEVTDEGSIDDMPKGEPESGEKKNESCDVNAAVSLQDQNMSNERTCDSDNKTDT